ncbi:MAG: glycosyltransferase, partial [Fimbriimonas ginsengisoli]|nr:glycosyltransferase [Fimbriimonas ginsengisoli]
GIVTRLSEQKGMDLVLAAGAELARKAQLIVLGTGDPALGAGFLALQAKNRTRVRFLEGFSIDMAPKIYAGSDLFLMPSAFEPCGLGQMIAMRYGTPPIVRRTGGLSNTVFEGENGFVFDLKTPEAMMAAVNRAVKAFKDPERWTKLMHAGMTGAYGWDGRASAYERVYERCAAARQAPVRVRA